MNKEELELYDMVLNSKKSFDVNYKELAISLRAELKETEERIDKAIEYIEKNYYDTIEDYKGYVIATIGVEELLDILKGSDE